MVVYAAGVLTFGVLLPLLAGQMLLMLMPSETMLGWCASCCSPTASCSRRRSNVSDYVSYRDVFHSGETLAPTTPGTSR